MYHSDVLAGTPESRSKTYVGNGCTVHLRFYFVHLTGKVRNIWTDLLVDVLRFKHHPSSIDRDINEIEGPGQTRCPQESDCFPRAQVCLAGGGDCSHASISSIAK